MHHASKYLGLILCLAMMGCEGSPLGQSIEKNLEPDARLLEEDVTSDAANSTPDTVSAPVAPATTASEDDESVEQTPETPTSTTAEGSVIPEFTQPSYIDLGEAPAELQPYLEDLVSLNVLMLIDVKADDNIERNPNEFLPNEIINRREYARWLLAANNRFYQDQAVRKIRPAVSSSQPTFQDVGMANIDFPAIQGLAEAGIIPSPLSGTATAVKFRPDAPLTRKDLVLWKVPLDQRAALPEATTTAVTEAWGFQDSGKIEPLALKAVLADHGNGEFANIRRALGYTTLFQPDKGVTRAEAAAVLWRFGNSTEGITANQLLIEPETKTDNEAQADSSDKPNRKQQGELNENP